ncbi:MAG: protein phosphatase [Rhodospirillaceae bacterium]|jgi:hypothetical protein|nr:protein phosphatase [Rhodospirillaceae bacterium]MBT6202608.1 protein phosphatase [Rhodospirillaceae bacterium]MBT6512448.1 protein phosphatase [Rhodospirillaceae bacterium]MBT7647668.1 protein phosphatase [Rhodospirillaceae bacterium]
MISFPIAKIEPHGGGRIGVCALPGRSGGLQADLKAVVDWGPVMVVSMTEIGEMQASGSQDLGEHLRGHGIDWVHLPIRDFGGPDGSSRDAWPKLAARLHACLDGGEGVLLHCRAGQGRAGMIATRLLVERGEEPKTALTRLRLVRAGAVETNEQFAWAASAWEGET